MRKEKEPGRPAFLSVQNWPLESISPVDIDNQVSMFPSRGPSILYELPEEKEDL